MRHTKEHEDYQSATHTVRFAFVSYTVSYQFQIRRRAVVLSGRHIWNVFAFLSYNRTPTHTKPTDWSRAGLLFSQDHFLRLNRYSRIPNWIPLLFNVTVSAPPFTATYSIATHYRQIMYCGSEKEKLSLSRGTWNMTLCAVISTAPEDGSPSSTTLRRSSPHTGLGNHIF